MSLMSASAAASPTVRSFNVLPRPSNRIGARATIRAVRSEVASASPVLTKLQKECATPPLLLRRVSDAMSDDMRAGLVVDGGSDLKMISSYVDALPTGDEKGLFYALDLGGTNFRVRRVQLGGKEGRVLATECEEFSIPQELMLGTSEELFGFIASKLLDFTAKEAGKFQLAQGRKREIGFTFSFPVNQTSIDSGTLIKWTKGFAVSGTEGKDVVACLNEAMEKQRLDMRVSALVNDAVGTLAGARYWDKDVVAAVILGTGTNACYVEQKNAIPKLKGLSSFGSTTIINTEWGAFSKYLPLTIFDKEMDELSLNPGEQIFEKTISGMYLGEIVRRVLLEMSRSNELFGRAIPDRLSIPFALRTPDLCKMQQDGSNDLCIVGSVMENVFGAETDLNARRTVLDVCDTIVKRGARLAGAGIVGVLEKMEDNTKRLKSGKRTVVAMDGGLYEHYPQYREYLQDAVSELLGHEVAHNVVIEHTKDGSGIGAALLAATNSMYGHFR